MKIYASTAVDPQLSTLADHGGPTWTMLPSAASPAVDSGGTCAFTSFDQRDYERCAGGLFDIGAVERQNPEDIIFRNGMDPN